MTDRTTVETIGESIVIKGELSGDVDLVIEGQVEGRINLNRNALTVGEHGKVNAKIVAKRVVVAGEVRGNIIATEAVDIRNTSSFEGDIWSPRLAIALGAYFRGGIDTRQSQSGRAGHDITPPTAAWTCWINPARRALRSRSPSGLFLLLLTRR